MNHPRSGTTGYFDQLGFDPARGVGTDPGYDPGFDALEVWNGRNVEGRAKVVDDWRALLRTGHRVTPTADTDTHGIVGQEAGYPRTYVRVGVDDRARRLGRPALGRPRAQREGPARRHVLHRTGRCCASRSATHVHVERHWPRAGLLKVKVHVECAPWISVDEVRVERAMGGAVPPPVPVKLAPTSHGSVAADVTIPLTFDADDAIYVVASGKKPMTPVLGGEPGRDPPPGP